MGTAMTRTARPTDRISASPVSWRGRHHHEGYARLLIAGGSLGSGPVHSIDRAPTSWLALAGGLIALVALVAAVVFVL
jgi:hypothetical protein